MKTKNFIIFVIVFCIISAIIAWFIKPDRTEAVILANTHTIQVQNDIQGIQDNIAGNMAEINSNKSKLKRLHKDVEAMQEIIKGFEAEK